MNSKIIKKLTTYIAFAIIIMCAIVFSACNWNASNSNDNTTNNSNSSQTNSNNGNTSPDGFDSIGGGQESGDQNNSVDTSEEVTSLKSAVSSVSSSITTEQTNSALPSEYNENVYEIITAGDYYFTSDITTPITVKKNSGTVHIYLDNANIVIENDKAINAKSGANVIITLIGDNTITAYGETASNAISTSENLTINGSGTLDITSTKSGIKCDSTFIGLGGNIIINAQSHGVSADNIYLDGTQVTVTECGKDGLHAESDYDELEDGTTAPTFSYSKGFVYIGENSAVDIQNSYGDGIQADSFVYIAGGKIDIVTTPTWVQYTATYNGEKGCYTKSGSTYTKVASDNVRSGSSYYQLEVSTKGIKVGEIDYTYASDTDNELTVSSDKYTILIEGGDISISTTDDAIHANSGNTIIYGGTMDVSTSDDGIHADEGLEISGGNITVSKSYEGLEGKTIDISGGTIVVTASDDGLNASNSDLTTVQQKQVCQINISGGKTYVNASGDGVDSNGGIKISGGELYVSGPTSNGETALDSENGIVITGGTVVAIGSSGMVETPSTSSTQCAIAVNLSSSQSGAVTVTDTSGNTLISFNPSSIWGTNKSYQSVVVSCPTISKGSTYTIKTGSTSTSVTTSTSSTITANGQSMGGGPGGMPGGRR